MDAHCRLVPIEFALQVDALRVADTDDREGAGAGGGVGPQLLAHSPGHEDLRGRDWAALTDVYWWQV